MNPKSKALSQPEAYAKAMKGAYKAAKKGGTLGSGFGGVAPKAKPIITSENRTAKSKVLKGMC